MIFTRIFTRTRRSVRRNFRTSHFHGSRVAIGLSQEGVKYQAKLVPNSARVVAFLLLAGLLLGSGSASASELPAAKPNVLFILLDNVGKDWFRCYGSSEDQTPNIDRLCRTGLKVRNCYVTPVCSTTRVMLLTGRYPFSMGWHTHHDPAIYGGGYFDWKRETSIARVMKAAGYETCISDEGIYSLTERGINMPLIVNCPKLVPGGRESDVLVDASDFLPTLAELAGAALPNEPKIDGRSFAAEILGQPLAKENQRDWCLSQYNTTRVVRNQRFRLDSNDQFYDLSADPLEQHNLRTASGTFVGEPDPATQAGYQSLSRVLEELPENATLPWEFRSISARKIRALEQQTPTP